MQSHQSYRIESLADLARVPTSQLSRCLKALGQDLSRKRAQHLDGVSARLLPDKPFTYPGFTWNPPLSPRHAEPIGLKPETPIRHLPVRPSARIRLEDLNVYCLEDLSAISEGEVARERDIGQTTVDKLRGWLHQIGLAFLPHPNPVRQRHFRSRVLRSLPPEALAEARDGLPDDAELAQLGLRSRTLSRATLKGYDFVGQLRNLRPRDLAIEFGKMEARELFQALKATGVSLKSDPSSLELWRCGLVDRENIERPTAAATPIQELEPWLGAAVNNLHDHGARTLGEAQTLARADSLAQVHGIGASRARHLSLELSPRKTPEVAALWFQQD